MMATRGSSATVTDLATTDPPARSSPGPLAADRPPMAGERTAQDCRLEPQPHHLRRERHDAVRRQRASAISASAPAPVQRLAFTAACVSNAMLARPRPGSPPGRRGDSVWWTHGLPPQSRPVAGLYARSLRSAASHAGGPESRPRERQRLNQRRDRARTSPSQTRPFRGPRPAGRTPPAQHPPKSPSWISPRQPLPGGARRHRAAYADVLRPAPNGAGSLRWWRCRRGNRPAPDQGVSGRKVGSTISMRLSAVSKPFHTYLWVAAKHTENSSSFSITSSLAMSQSSGSAPPRAT